MQLAMMALMTAVAAAPPPEAFQVMAPEAAGPRITPYLRYQLDQAWRQDDARRARFDSVKTEEDLLRLRASLRARLLGIIGGLPDEKTPLNARVTGTVPMDGYRIEKVIFESQPGLHVTALLYVPDGAGPHPAVLVPCGHAPDGKSYKNYQELSGQLARRGYVVLSWDPVGQGERSQFWDAAKGRSRYNLACGEHAVLGNLACLAGTTLNRYEVWDGMRAVDYLLTRPEVDGARLSITGTSGGGLQSLWLGALDERIGVVAPSCYVTSLPMRMANRIFEDPDSDPEQDPFEMVSAGIDHAGLLLLVYPRPVIVASAVKDFVPIEGARKTVREVERLYRAFGRGDRIALVEGYHEHMYSPQNRRAAFAFIDRFNRMPVRETLDAIRILDPVQLRCTPTGQVRVDLPGRSLPEVIREDGRARGGRARAVADEYRAHRYAGIAGWTVVPWDAVGAANTLGWEEAGTTAVDGIRIDRYRLHHDGMVVPLLHVRDAGRKPASTLLDLRLEGKAGPSDWSALRDLVKGGQDVLSFDLRGTGETRMVYRAESVDDPALAAADERAAYFSPLSGVLANHVYNALLTGRPYFLEMIEDAEIVVRFARERLGADTIRVRGRGDAGLLAESVGETLGLGVDPGEPGFRWSEAVDRMQEAWPIHYLYPDGAHLRPGGAAPR